MNIVGIDMRRRMRGPSASTALRNAPAEARLSSAGGAIFARFNAALCAEKCARRGLSQELR